MKILGILSLLMAFSAFAKDIQVHYFNRAGEQRHFQHKVGPVKYPVANYCLKSQIDYLKIQIEDIAEDFTTEVFVTEDYANNQFSICGVQASVTLKYESPNNGFANRTIPLKEYQRASSAIQSAKEEANLISLTLSNIKIESKNQYFFFNNTTAKVVLSPTSENTYLVKFSKKATNEVEESIDAFYEVRCKQRDGYKVCNRVDPYNLDLKNDIIITSSGVALVAISYLLGINKPHLSIQDVNSLNVNDVNKLERFITNNWNLKFAKASDILLMASFALPLTILINKKFKTAAPKYGLMYLETLLLTYGATNIVKNAVHRPRPFAYNPNAPLDRKLNQDTLKSFFSGHTSFAFATSIFFAKVFNDNYPNSKFRPYVWGSAFVLASTVAAFRVVSGKHFISDILVGAIVGSAIGYLVPKLHLKKNKKLYIYPVMGPDYQGAGVILRL